jgi:hypothetical protein
VGQARTSVVVPRVVARGLQVPKRRAVFARISRRLGWLPTLMPEDDLRKADRGSVSDNKRRIAEFDWQLLNAPRS